ncbi:hypothetical protein [Caballeronia sp. KNU42]
MQKHGSLWKQAEFLVDDVGAHRACLMSALIARALFGDPIEIASP